MGEGEGKWESGLCVNGGGGGWGNGGRMDRMHRAHFSGNIVGRRTTDDVHIRSINRLCPTVDQQPTTTNK